MAIKLIKDGVFCIGGKKLLESSEDGYGAHMQKKETYKTGSMAYKILDAHSTDNSGGKLKLRFDALASHDITYVGIIQTARASGLKEFPVPYVLTNCHNSLGAVGGTINEDDHVFGLSAAQKYGGIFVPAHLAVIHTYMREAMSRCGSMILGSDSHTRYGALGTLAFGEGGPEIVKQLLGKTRDIDCPEVIAVCLSGKPRDGVGPQDVALAIIGEVFKNGFVKDKILEFVGDGIDLLPIEFRNGIDVMTTETGCLSSIWITDEKTKKYYETHGRAQDFKDLKPDEIAYYDGAVKVDLSKIECMIALPFHPSETYKICELNENLEDIAEKYGLSDKIDKTEGNRLKVDQGIIAGCAGGTFDNICAAADILKEKSVGSGEFGLSIYPGSQPTNLQLTKNGVSASLMASGAIMRSAFCGPCFGADNVPANGGFSIRHTTRNFPNREGSKPSEGQLSRVALMDARSIAATAANGGRLTAATELEIDYKNYDFSFDGTIYQNRVYFGYKNPKPESNLKFGPNIADWPTFSPLAENIVLKLCSVICDEVTTTDELIPSGETSSYRSNPQRLAEFALSRKDPGYVKRAKEAGENAAEIAQKFGADMLDTAFGSVIYANKPGDGSAREQAASCQKVLGGFANIAREYATKRYRSNLINWGMIPFIYSGADLPFSLGDYIFVPNIKEAIKSGATSLKAYVANGDLGSPPAEIELIVPELTEDERDIILAGCLINYYKNNL